MSRRVYWRQYASIYVRQEGQNGVRWEDGPYPLDQAVRRLDQLVADGLLVRNPYFPVVYYELRGLGECLVRYRVWIDRPAPVARVEPLMPNAPGRRPDSVVLVHDDGDIS